MKCVVCRNGATRSGKSTVTLERGGTILVVKGVPAQVCENCGEEYLDEAEAGHLLDTAEEAARAGVEIDVRDYAA
ncbi:MAG: type II toxin-antitoxin system MqsA family antitoxin [Rhodospirillales bacterium]|jgi:YgiT-type zinc finger domain-containing protein|nr:type II toxin-antitoxin system MqsA family antitoxin [Rhodospirillales bacterium]HIJ43712.1 type II toxin-antitoxin system MqsA family antitoxin [Rhodospirillaceae bacterium]MDP7216109.1 type II toxin-antitoxin system MqsA family antitoxin [Rhodospirillales bacterium]HIJ44646.1 type II toxin-antitoxin system MqsA family antitoxin [Rhodospirillaceae bacterium]HIJ93843.1 type II toxin-antitoxin system MqsA family antitoxin [Rhodospirillaceae bacterium]